MDTISGSIGELAPGQHLAEDLPLPVLDSVGAVARCRQAIDAAAAQRRGLLVVGPKGCGKGVGITHAMQWFREIEKGKHDLDTTYRRRRVLRVGNTLRDCDYRETGVQLAKVLDTSYRDRVRGRKKQENEIRQDFMQLCLKQNYAVVLLDEAERCSDETLLFVRDLMADAEEADPARNAIAGATSAAGIGIVIVGDQTVENRITRTNEAGERWARVLRVESLSPEEITIVFEHWFPGFEGHIRKIGSDAWQAYLTSGLFRGADVSFRLIENLARTYVHYIARTRPEVDSRERIPFDSDLFETALSEVTWAKTGRGCEASARTGAGSQDLRRTA